MKTLGRGCCLLGHRLFTKDDIEQHKRSDLPEWFLNEYKTFSNIVTRQDFPCSFGYAGHTRGELRYSYISHDDWAHLPQTLEAFNALFSNQERLIRHGFFLFVEPETAEHSLEYYRSYFWDILQYLYDHDPYEWPKDYPKHPDHHLWSFSFAGDTYFVFGNTPAYKQRKTRDLGNSLILGFQPRQIFAGLEGDSKSGRRARENIRKRVEKWDQLPKHPNISHYGDTSHREWKQYFIGDDTEEISGDCPFRPN